VSFQLERRSRFLQEEWKTISISLSMFLRFKNLTNELVFGVALTVNSIT
jgi:hypothetical protein